MFSKKMIEFINTELSIFSLNKFKIFDNLKIDLIFNKDTDRNKLASNIQLYINEFKRKEKEIKKVILFNNPKINYNNEQELDSYYQVFKMGLNNYLSFFKSEGKIYKFNNDFVKDYMNYDLNFESILENNSISFNEDCIIIYAENLFKTYEDISKLNLVIISKLDVLESRNNGKTKILNFSFRNIEDNNYIYDVVRQCDSSYDLIQAYKNHVLKNDEIDRINHQNVMIKNIIKLVLYIQSSNVDLRKISPEISIKNTRKGRDRANTNNIKNDSLIEYYNVGYSWNKLPIYSMDQWSVRGHFRMQPCGENRKSHKIIFIEPQVRKRQACDVLLSLK